MSEVPLTIQTLESFAAIASLAWWIYIVIIILIFFGGLLLNYIVKKINDSRLETRLQNLSNRAAANQATQIQRSIAEPDRPILPTNGISLVCNKEDNLRDDKRRKDEPYTIPPIGGIQVNLTIAENIEQQPREEIMESVFLGSIYKELFENRLRVQRSKSLSSTITRRDSIMSDIFNKMVWKKITESKSTPSVKKLCSINSEEYLRERILDLVRNAGPDDNHSQLISPTNLSIHSEAAGRRDLVIYAAQGVTNHSQMVSTTNLSIHSEAAERSDKNLPIISVQQCSVNLSHTSSGV